MKDGKRIAAIIGIILLLAVFCSPMYFAVSGQSFNMNYFIAALITALFVPMMIMIMMWVYKKTRGDKKQEEHKMKNIIFDVGNVLVYFEWQSLMDSFHFPVQKRKRIVDAIFTSKIWDERDRALYEDEEYVDRMVAKAPDLENEIRAFMQRTPECITVTEYAVDWVKYLKQQGYHLYVLSNYGHYMLEANKPDMKFLKYMDGVVFSCYENQIKPEPDIYKTLLDRYHLDPKKSVFLDDRQDNLNTARQLGIQTVLFRNFKQATAELEKRFDIH